ncbi:MAG: hypothetical protein COV36_05540 [Alphaproteobacteria bacterium CG11_big_fil_rev_8_21_14_0_20_44_7]|nr:MAG: hypothetical protein COV36_05540 [Alphaproteobacteria bacterium CG11_big_fil_rev_8_21_14_0_20_44_7]
MPKTDEEHKKSVEWEKRELTRHFRTLSDAEIDSWSESLARLETMHEKDGIYRFLNVLEERRKIHGREREEFQDKSMALEQAVKLYGEKRFTKSDDYYAQIQEDALSTVGKSYIGMTGSQEGIKIVSSLIQEHLDATDEIIEGKVGTGKDGEEMPVHELNDMMIRALDTTYESYVAATVFSYAHLFNRHTEIDKKLINGEMTAEDATAAKQLVNQTSYVVGTNLEEFRDLYLHKREVMVDKASRIEIAELALEGKVPNYFGFRGTGPKPDAPETFIDKLVDVVQTTFREEGEKYIKQEQGELYENLLSYKDSLRAETKVAKNTSPDRIIHTSSEYAMYAPMAAAAALAGSTASAIGLTARVATAVEFIADCTAAAADMVTDVAKKGADIHADITNIFIDPENKTIRADKIEVTEKGELLEGYQVPAQKVLDTSYKDAVGSPDSTPDAEFHNKFKLAFQRLIDYNTSKEEVNELTETFEQATKPSATKPSDLPTPQQQTNNNELGNKGEENGRY